MEKIEVNIQFEQVLAFVNQTAKNIFLTGKAGTGKTTLLRYIKSNTYKQMAIVAPTGVAAINAGGTTIHSFFQFPFTPFIPQFNADGSYKKGSLGQFVQKYNSQRLAILRNLDLLVIDEISMVRADLLDQIDASLRHTRKKWDQPFGGVQVLMIGDMFQLPPVVRDEEWLLLRSVYASPYFFDSLVIRNEAPVYIELDKIYRQKEEKFIDILNKVRNNELGLKDLVVLNERYRNDLSVDEKSTYITLTTHNRKADEINAESLQNLKGKEFKFKCKTDGVFPEKNYPADEILILKNGTRVMFLKNNNEKNYYNGKTGTVVYVDEEKIKVKCDEDNNEIEVGRETWNNVSFSVDKTTSHIEEDVIGTFTQYPLRLAWAITIHKSQGLTFDKLIIDAEEAFTSGQVYVALSRCRGMEGLILSSRISAESLFNDKKVLQFSTTKQSREEVNELFNGAKQYFTAQALFSVFELIEIKRERDELAGYIQLHKSKLNPDGLEWIARLNEQIDQLYDVGSKFKNQLGKLMQGVSDLEQNTELNERVKKAASYFSDEVEKLIAMYKDVPLRSQSKEASDDIDPELKRIFELIHGKKALINSCRNGFNFSDLIKAKLELRLPEYKFSIYSSAKNTKIGADVKHPDLFRKLMLVRDEICNDEHKPIFIVLKNESLKQLSEFLPEKEEDLLAITGFGKAKIEMYGSQFLKVIKSYLSENELSTNMSSVKKVKKAKKSTKKAESEGAEGITKDTKRLTYELYKKGLSLEEISKQRNFALTTIEGHLIPFIASGEIKIDQLISKEKQKKIKKALKGFDKSGGIKMIKDKLPDSITYSDIRWMMAIDQE